MEPNMEARDRQGTYVAHIMRASAHNVRDLQPSLAQSSVKERHDV